MDAGLARGRVARAWRQVGARMQELWEGPARALVHGAWHGAPLLPCRFLSAACGWLFAYRVSRRVGRVPLSGYVSLFHSLL